MDSFVSVVVVPSAASRQLRRFCELNKAIFPLFYQSRIGEITAGQLNRESDIRYEELVYGHFALRSFRSNSYLFRRVIYKFRSFNS